jgi:lipoprotein-anchoring transpeptidase ErfK/SrfK
MRGVLGGFTTAYVLAACMCGGAVFLFGHDLESKSTVLAGQIDGMVAELKLRASPPESITFSIMPLHLPLRGSLLEDRPAAEPTAPAKNPNATPKAKSSPAIQFAADPASPATVALVADRLHANLNPELYSHFDLFLYVSKADAGPWAQLMYAFAKKRVDGKPELSLLNTWPVSTGRESMETNPHGVAMMTDTPAGYYQLDPDRFFRHYRSMQWGMQMPNSMFLNWVTHGNPTGLAIHGVATPEEIAMIGQRASAGCVELAPEDSRKLFDLIKSDYKGRVPRFAYDRKSRTTNNQGKLARDKNGSLKMMDGYRVLVLIENYGGSDTVSQLYVDSADING